jgi:disulfide bond formation protein DsbB
MLTSIGPSRAAWLVLAATTATLAAAWLFQFAGYVPCDLCYKQRWAYYAAAPLSLLLAVLNPVWIRYGLMLILAILAGSTVLGGYHAGVEWGWWPGPSTCGGGQLSGLLPDLSAPVVKCDEAALRIPPFAWGLSLAGWNAVISAALAFVTLKGLARVS